MAYTITFNLALGSSKAGILSSLRGKLIDINGNDLTTDINSGFVEVGNGNYLWTYNNFPHGFRGGVKFYQNSAPSVILGLASVNPEEIENNIKDGEISINIGSEEDNIVINSGMTNDNIKINSVVIDGDNIINDTSINDNIIANPGITGDNISIKPGII